MNEVRKEKETSLQSKFSAIVIKLTLSLDKDQH